MGEKRSMAELNRLSVEEFRRAGKIPVTVILENIRSGLNVGSIFRSADAFRIAHIVCVGYTPAPPHREVLKTALGATDSVEWSQFPDMPSCLMALSSEQMEFWAIEQVKGSVPLEAFVFHPDRHYAFVFGNEVSGVSEDTLGRMMGAVEIVQFGTKHSLNVAVTAGIVLHHCARQLRPL